jgi:predicted DNA-binding antitoxin AbrB/MazE fold protein
MAETYEATYQDGILTWMHEKPKIKNGTKVTVVVADAPSAPNKDIEETRRIVEAARGAWGKSKTLDQIDCEIREMRERDWSRDWDK